MVAPRPGTARGMCGLGGVAGLTFCIHSPRSIEWDGGQAHLSSNGNWWSVNRKEGSLEAMKLTTCPGCGVKLWGLPAEAINEGSHL